MRCLVLLQMLLSSILMKQLWALRLPITVVMATSSWATLSGLAMSISPGLTLNLNASHSVVSIKKSDLAITVGVTGDFDI